MTWGLIEVWSVSPNYGILSSYIIWANRELSVPRKHYKHDRTKYYSAFWILQNCVLGGRKHAMNATLIACSVRLQTVSCLYQRSFKTRRSVKIPNRRGRSYWTTSGSSTSGRSPPPEAASHQCLGTLYQSSLKMSFHGNHYWTFAVNTTQ